MAKGDLERRFPCQCKDPTCRANFIKVYKSVERLACYERTIRWMMAELGKAPK